MKTIQISDELWKRLRVEAAERCVTMREVIETMGAEWEARRPTDVIGLALQATASRGVAEALRALEPGPVVEPKELTVELEK